MSINYGRIDKMADINFHNLKKKELQLFLTGRCKHRHMYYEHPACFLRELNLKPRIGYLDIETSNLKANIGIMLSYCIKDGDSKKIYSGVIKKSELMDGTLDKRLVEDCINDMWKFDKIVTYYGTRFDVPFLRTRALFWDVEFPKYSQINHKDCYYMVRNKMCLHSNRLENACRLMGIKGKTHVDWNYWIRALTGDEKSLKYILDHNKKDVIILEKLYNKLLQYVRDTNKSI